MFTILWIYDKSRIKGDVKKVVVLAGGNHTVEAPPPPGSFVQTYTSCCFFAFSVSTQSHLDCLTLVTPRKGTEQRNSNGIKN